MKTLPSLISTALLGVTFIAAAGAQAPSTQGIAPAPPPPPGMGMGGPHHGGRQHMGPDGMDMGIPPGTWWRDQNVVSKVGISTEQQKHIDNIFLESRVQLIHMHASLEEEQLKLDSTMHATPFNQNEALAQVSKIADTRADLEKANAKMLLTIRGVLSADQWTKLQAAGPGPGEPRPDAMGGKRGDRGDHRGQSRGGRPDGPGGPGGPGNPGGPEGFLPPGS